MNSATGGGAAAVSRVSIPSSVRKTIQNIKEITGNHSDEEIYAMLKECSMDPNETAQKLLFQDTFHEVKRKRDRRKENLNKESLESRWKQGTQGRGNRGSRGKYPSHYIGNADSGGGSNRKENGSNFLETQNKETTTLASLSTSVASGPLTVASGKSTIVQDGLASAGKGVVNQSEIVPCSDKLETPLSVASPVNVKKNLVRASGTREMHGRQVGSDCVTSITSSHSSGSNLSASDAVLMPSQDSRLLVAVGAISREGGSHQGSTEEVPVKPEKSKLTSASEIVNTKLQGKVPNKSQGNGKNQLTETSQTVLSTHAGSSTNRPSSNYNNRSQVTGLQKGPSKEWKPKSSSSSVAHGPGTTASSEIPAASIEANSQLLPVTGVLSSDETTLNLQWKLEETHISDGKHVIIPNHLHVPEAERLGFCFGSFDASFGESTTYTDGHDREKGSAVTETSEGQEETTSAQLSSNQINVATAEERENPDQPQPSSHGPENISNEGEVSSFVAQESSVAKQEVFHGGHPDAMIHSTPSYNFGFVPPILGSQIAPFDNLESQAREVPQLANFVVPQSIDPSSFYAQFYRSGAESGGRISPFHSTGGAIKYSGNVSAIPQSSLSPEEGANPLGLSSAAPAPLVTQAAGLMQSALAVNQQPVPVFRQQPGMHLSHYPANYIPYGHYFSPFYIPPATMHQFLSSGAFPQQPQAGSIYTPPPAVTAKYSVPQYKPGTNVGNSTHNGAAGGYGLYGSSVSNYTHSSVITAGNQSPNDDLAASQFKESNTYSSGQQTEGSAVWITPPGQDISSLQASSFYSLPQGQVAFTPAQPGHGSFASVYHPPQPMTAATVHPLLQQSQTVAGPVEMVRPASAAVYQQTQHSPTNWPSNY